MKLISSIWNEIRSGESIDVYITLAIVIIVASLGIVGIVNQEVVSSAILATLALISISILVTRHENQHIRQTLRKIQSDSGISERFLKKNFDRTILNQYISTAHEVSFWGYSFTSTIPSLRDQFDKRLKSGLNLRFLLIEPNSSAVPLITIPRNDEKVDYLNNTLKRNLDQLAQHARNTSSGRVEVRLLGNVPPYTMYVFDPHLPTGRIFVRLADYNVSREHQPWFELTAVDDEVWFKFFLNQFEIVWKTGKEYPLTEDNEV